MGMHNEKAKFERFDINAWPPGVISITLRLRGLKKGVINYRITEFERNYLTTSF